MSLMFLPLRRYAEFSGRSRRMEYWLFVLFQVIVALMFGVIFGAAMFSAFATRGAPNLGALFASMGIAFLIFGLFWLAMLLPTLAVAVRRLHDTDRSGWWLMLYIGPYLLMVVVQVLAFLQNFGVAGPSPLSVMINGLLSLVWMVSAVVLLVFMCLHGTLGPTRFGPHTLSPDPDFADTFP